MAAVPDATFKRNYQTHLKHLKLKGLQPKTIEAYSRAIRRIGAYFDHQIDDLSEQQLTDYSDVRTTQIYTHVLQRGASAVRSPLGSVLGLTRPGTVGPQETRVGAD